MPEAQDLSRERSSAMVAGLLLCRAADGYLAFRARDVVQVEAWAASARSPHARLAFGYSPKQGRALVSADGDAVGVDEVSVFAEPATVLATPALLDRALGKSIAGFVYARDRLWPVLRLSEFSRFLAASGGPL
jgi:hypothetical protein